MLRPFNTFSHVLMMPSHKIISLLLYNCNFATVINHKYPCFPVVLGDLSERVIWPPQGLRLRDLRTTDLQQCPVPLHAPLPLSCLYLCNHAYCCDQIPEGPRTKNIHYSSPKAWAGSQNPHKSGMIKPILSPWSCPLCTVGLLFLYTNHIYTVIINNNK